MRFNQWIILLSCSNFAFSLSCYDSEPGCWYIKECSSSVEYCYIMDGAFYGVHGIAKGCASPSSRPLCKSEGCREESGIYTLSGWFKGRICCCSKDECNGEATIETAL
ncbi:hypothetical protein AB6A40_010567 [Gnathostoma spinigerum]|uniref:UPAR/Ly6 domain-containing protein n=1 Tax=Gnathostoma spinigerum TaxID=75299 RepID=A0ABD6EV88_9BILA